MYFNLIKIFILSFLLCGCNWGALFSTQDRSPNFKAPTVDLTCLPMANETIASFWKGEVPQSSDLEKSWHCYDYALENFIRFFSGQKNSSQFTISELVTLLNSYFRKDQTPLRLELVSELVRIKQIFIGGDENLLTKEELSRLKILLRDLESYSIRINELMPYFYGKNNVEKFLYLKSVLSEIFYEFGNKYSVSTGKYSFQNGFDFIKEANILFNGNLFSLSDAIETFDKVIPILTTLKESLIGGSPQYFTGEEWSFVSTLFIDSYMQYVWVKRFINDSSIPGHVRIERWTHLLNMIDNSIVSLKKRKGDKPILTKEQIVDIILKAGKHFNLLKTNISRESLDGVIDVLLRNVFILPNERLNQDPQFIDYNFRYKSFLEIKKLILLYLESEKVAYEIFSGISYLNNELELFGIENSEKITFSSLKLIEILTAKLNGSEENTDIRKTYLREILKVFKSPIDLVINSQGRLHISGGKKQKYDFESFRARNIDMLIAHLIQHSTSDSIDNIYNLKGISEPEGEKLFRKIFPFLLEMEWFENKDSNFLKKRFKEASLFGPRSDGDEWADFGEIADIVSMLFSGARISSELKRSLFLDCGVGEIRLFDVYIDSKCLKGVLHRKLSSTYSGLPDLLNFYGGNSPDRREKYLNGIINAAAGEELRSGANINIDDIQTIPHLMQYIEMIFVRFDRNQNGLIEREEAEIAFPVFRPMLRKIPEIDSSVGSGRTFEEKDLFYIFCYLMAKQKIPKTDMEKTWFWLWVKTESIKPASFADSREQISTIMGLIAHELGRTLNP